MLFVEGQVPRGIFVLCKGSVKLSINSPSGRTMIVKLAEPGEVLGLSATISGKPYELCGRQIHPARSISSSAMIFWRFLKGPSRSPGWCRRRTGRTRLSPLLCDNRRVRHSDNRGFRSQIRSSRFSTWSPPHLAEDCLHAGVHDATKGQGTRDKEQGTKDSPGILYALHIPPTSCGKPRISEARDRHD